jgi:hypothetical protein
MLTFIGHGYQIDLKLEPFVSAGLSISESDEGVCPNDKQKHTLGVVGEPTIGADLTVGVSKAGEEDDDPFLEVTLAVSSYKQTLLLFFSSSPKRDIASIC